MRLFLLFFSEVVMVTYLMVYGAAYQVNSIGVVVCVN